MTRKPIIIGVSLILVVGVVIGAVLVNRNSHSSDDKNLSTNIKAVQAICAPTTYSDKCISTIAPVAANASAGPKDFIRAILVASIEEMKGGLEKSKSVKVDNQIINQRAIEGCKKFIQYAVEDLEEILSKLDGKELTAINDDEVYDFRIWLSSVITYQMTCLDEIADPNLKSEIQNVLLNATLLTNNAVDIFTELYTILRAYNIPLNENPNHRKLLDVGSVDEQGYPHWFSEESRRLLVEAQKPDAIVSKDGKGTHPSIQAAILSYPKDRKPPPKRFVIYVKAGIYNEVNLNVPKNYDNVYMYGDGPDKTVITGSKSVVTIIPGAEKPVPTKYGTSDTGSFTVLGDNFVCKSMGFKNTAGPIGEQAVALRVQSDKAAFFKCRIEGHQDTLYEHTGRQFYRECNIIGTIDFVFGNGITVIQNSVITSIKPGEQQTETVVAADGKNKTNAPSALAFQNCRFVADNNLRLNQTLQTNKPNSRSVKSYLARPWKESSIAIFMESFIDDFISPEGFLRWKDGEPNNVSCSFWEYKNTGPGARTDRRVKWTSSCHKVITNRNELRNYTVASLLRSNDSSWPYGWLDRAGLPYNLRTT